MDSILKETLNKSAHTYATTHTDEQFKQVNCVRKRDALDIQDDTTRIILAQGGDYILQVKANQKGIARQCEARAYLAGDPADADFPGVTMVVRTFRQIWSAGWKGKRDNGYHEDKLTHRLDLSIMSAMMVVRSLGMWVRAQSPGMSTEAVQRDLFRHPAKLMRIMTKRRSPRI